MDPATVTGFILAVIAIVSLLVAWHQDRMNHTVHRDTQLKATILNVLTDALKPVHELLAAHTAQLAQHSDRDSRVEDSVKENSRLIRELSAELTKQGVKVDMYWTTLEQLAMNAAKGLHQPDPARARIDHLLESFVEGTLTDGERTELKKYLVQIRNYEPGTALEFPVQPGEQTFAAILLSTMDAVDPRRLAARGHTLHRSARDKEKKNGNSGQ